MRSLKHAHGNDAVLVVDDDESVRGIVVRILERAGFGVLQARDGVEALQVSSEADVSIRLLLTDVRMPGMSGDELAESFSQRHPGTAVLLMSGYADPRRGKEHALLTKPFRPAELLAAVDQVLASNNSGHAVPRMIPDACARQDCR